MSLMNDALRKKKREGTSVSPPPGFAAEGRRPWNARWWGLAGALLVMGAVLGGIYLQAGSDRGLLLIDPASARPLPPAADGAAPSAPDASPQATVTHRPLTGEEAPAASPVTSAGTSPASKPAGLTPAVEAAPPGDRPPRVLPEATQAEPVATEGGALGYAGQALDTPPQAVDRSFEPGPAAAAPRPQLAAVVPAQRKTADRPKPAAPVQVPATDDTADRQTAAQSAEPNLFYQKALACHRSGRLTEAVRLYRHVIRLDGAHTPAMLNLAALFIETGRFGQAQPLLERLEKHSPRPAGVLLNLAITAIGRNAPQKALDYLDRAAAQHDASPWEIRFHRAAALSLMNRHAESLALYQEVAGERPGDPRVRFNLAVTCDTLGLYGDALAHYEAVLRDASALAGDDRRAVIDRSATLRRYLNSSLSLAKGR